MYKEIVEKLLAYPQRGQIQLDFDLNKKAFKLTVPIFSSKKLPTKIKDYVLSRKNFSFKPHMTSYHLDGEKVFLIQEIPFHFPSSSRQDVDAFWQMSRYCHRLLSEIAIEDVYQNALTRIY